ncbi:MAG: hypothetical protein MI757_15370, partial [Pirellulales bacterium]|nr:hypothetical protein [Pirellulales bacterium]
MKRSLTTSVTGLLVATMFVCAIVPQAVAVDPNSLRRQRASQEQARRIARQLVFLVLEEQLEPLRQNGLTELPIYQEIKAMQSNVDALVDEEMKQVVDLLANAQDATGDDRKKIYGEAREAIRIVLVRVAVEQQRLLRRLRLARVAADVRSLIKQQERALLATRALPEQSSTDRETRTIEVIHDQRDIQTGYGQLHKMLEDVSGWGGEIGAGAADGIAILKEGKVRTHVDGAVTMLQSVRTVEA